MPIYTETEWPHGLRCLDCDALFVDGMTYHERLEGFIEDTPLCDVVCGRCALPDPTENE